MATDNTISCYWKGPTSWDIETLQDGSRVLQEARLVSFIVERSSQQIWARIPKESEPSNGFKRLTLVTHPCDKPAEMTIDKIRQLTTIAIGVVARGAPSAQADDGTRTDTVVQVQMPEEFKAGCKYNIVISSTINGQVVSFTASLEEATTAASSTVEATTAALAKLTTAASSTAEATQASASAAPPEMRASTPLPPDLTTLSIDALQALYNKTRAEQQRHEVSSRIAFVSSNPVQRLEAMQKTIELSTYLAKIQEVMKKARASAAEATQARASAVPPAMSASTPLPQGLTQLSTVELALLLDATSKEFKEHNVVIGKAFSSKPIDIGTLNLLSGRVKELSDAMLAITTELKRRQDAKAS